jgi:Flp pilus assembly protein TadG
MRMVPMLTICAAVHRLARGFLRQCRGSAVPTFAIALVPMVALVGAAVDYSRANNIRSQMQGALDAAVLAGARNDTASWIQTAQNTFTALFQPNGSAGTAPSFVLNGNGSFTGAASAVVTMDFLGSFGISAINVKATATAMVAPTSPQSEYCLLALNLTAAQSMKVAGNGNITITAPSCVMQVNSNSSDAVDLSGNANVSTTDNCFVGSLRSVDHSSISPAPDAVCKTLPDPFANYLKPSIPPCTYGGDSGQPSFSLSGNKTVTLSPGVYCGGMNFSGNVNVTFDSSTNNGLFIIKDGAVTESGGTFTGNGVTFFLTGSGAGLQMSGQANWHLVAPIGGPMAGFVIFLDPNGPSGAAAASSQLSGQSELYFEGVVYLPKQLVTITGTAEAFAPSPWTSFIADNFQITGNGSIVIHNDTSLTSVPIPAGLKMRTGGRLWLMQ